MLAATNMLSLNFIALGASLAAVFWTAGKTLAACVAFSQKHAISPFVVGAIIIGFGTSSPELAVSILASLKEQGAISIGNVIGSNIANLSLVAGAAALVGGIYVNRQILKWYFPIVLVISLLPGLLMLDSELGQIDGIILLLTLAVILFLFLKQKRTTVEQESDIHQIARKIRRPEINLFIYLILLVVVSEIAVRTAVNISQILNIDPIIIGLTVIAVGTSLPELAAALTGVYYKQHDIAIGNILGSNVYNALGVLGAAVVIHPVPASNDILFRYFPIMGGITVLLWLLFALSRKMCITKISGVLLLGYFVSFLTFLYFSSTT